MKRLATAVATDRWILDGNFLDNGPLDERFERADTVIFLDRSRLTCLWRVLTRRLRDRGLLRPDLPDGCSEGFDRQLIRWIWRHPHTDRPRVLNLLDGLGGGIAVHHLRSRRDVRTYFQQL